MIDPEQIDGWLFPEEGALLDKYAAEVVGRKTVFEGFPKILELGSYKGKSTVYMGRDKMVQIVCVDTFMSDATTRERKDTLQEFLRNTEDLYNVVVVPTTTEKAKTLLTSGRLPLMYDLIFVDADHSYEACRKDVEMFLPHLRENGYLILHDAFGENGEETETPWPGVTQVTRELREQSQLHFVEKCRRCAVFKKV